MELVANLQPDLMSDDCRDLLIKYLRKHEATLDPETPITQFIVNEIPRWKAGAALQSLTGTSEHRIRVAKELLGYYYGREACWKGVRKQWDETNLSNNSRRRSIKSFCSFWIPLWGLVVGVMLYRSFGYLSSI